MAAPHDGAYFDSRAVLPQRRVDRLAFLREDIDSLPQYGRRPSLPRFPLIHHGLVGRADRGGELRLSQAGPSPKCAELDVVICGNCRERLRHRRPSDPSSAAAVVAAEVFQAIGDGRERNRSTEYHARTVHGGQTSISDCSSQGVNTHANRSRNFPQGGEVLARRVARCA